MLGAEAAYCGLEADLQHYLDTYESTHDYDEYHFDLDEIEHDPYVLTFLMRSMRDNGRWTRWEGLQMLFDRQYIFTEDVVVETRYRTKPRTDRGAIPYGHKVPYDYYICTVTLENLRPVPSACVRYGRGSAFPVCHLYGNAGKPPRPVPGFSLCEQVHYGNPVITKSRRISGR